jgi:hypothetical protein
MRRLLQATHIGLLVISMLAAGTLSTAVRASSHREAPSTSVDPMVDATDVYAFVDPNDPTKVNLIMNFIPFQLPQGGPNFYRFDDNVEYAMRIDNNGDAITDIQYVFRFRTVVGNPNTFLYNTGPVTSLNDPDLNIKQFYSISVIRGNAPNMTTTTLAPTTAAAGSPAGFPFAVPPVNVGPRSTPDYETNLAQPAVTTIGTANGDARVFAGQREEGFFIDVGSIFDLFGLRPFNSAHLIPRTTQPGVDGLAGFNVSTIAMQIPIAALTRTGAAPTGVNDPNAVISVYSASSRTAMIAFAEDRSGRVTFSGNFVQVSRLGNPLVNELIIPLGMKDRFNASLPGSDAQFLGFILDPEPGRLFGYPGAAGSPGKMFDLYPSFDAPAPPRADVANVFLTGLPGLNAQTNTSSSPSVMAYSQQVLNTIPQERLRINLAIGPSVGAGTATATGNRLGAIAGDPGGFPNGRRLGDDVVDIELRVLAGVTGTVGNVAPNNQLGDGVNQNDVPFMTVFPYLATPRSGYDSPTSTAVGTTVTDAVATVPPSPTPRP